ncbi:P-loop containing nucleoside triphosphate hydrolase protein [Dactylonectria macrodidyma]|uniref:P-loop containing nucleoside triphosphate hydrolase protein n=1 Tax=Dactylonectria macrodidyma TaxID=307937 RepID=A0A9P9IUL0_9HYPO|nr:P-loop containing nucleoside triphosphate hydrolase protein [Dactylonectria macrodidyma]
MPGLKIKGLHPEETSGVLSTTFFWWMNSILALGNSRILSVDDTPPLDTRINPKLVRSQFLIQWQERAKPDSQLSLLKVLVRHLRKPFLSVVFPRLFLVIFRCSQPIIIHETILFISQSGASTVSPCDGPWILLAAFTVYLGLPISSSLYQHRLNRLQIMMRGSLTTLIYNKALNMSSESTDAGKVITLMSTDIAGVMNAGTMFHETWGQFLELTIGLIILASQVRWVWPVPLILIFFSSRVSHYVAKNIRSRQKDWNMATQERMSALSSLLGSMKSLKLLGATENVVDYIRGLRQNEIHKSKNVRWMNVAYNASANALGIFTPVITMALFAIGATARGSALDVATPFTTIAALTVVTHPANMIMTIVPRAVASFASLERIQEFLLSAQHQDQRDLIMNPPASHGTSVPPVAAQIMNVTVKHTKTQAPILQNISIELPQASITICCGPVGSGKSILAKLLLGEIPPTDGKLMVTSGRIAFCDQKAWLPTGTIKDIICAFTDNIDERRYMDAIEACCLRTEIETFPEKHLTYIGNRGINLSGGQQQRVALARVLYSCCTTVVLDDPVTALDGTTEAMIINNLLGPNGWFRNSKTTVFFITNSAQYFHVADKILLLNGGQVKAQGNAADMQAGSTEISKFSFAHETSAEASDGSEVAHQHAKTCTNPDADGDLHRRTGDLALYGYYFRSAGIFNTLCLVFCTASYSVFITFPHYWIKWWTEDSADRSSYYMAGYVLFASIAWATTSAQMWSTYILLAPRSGDKLHQRLLTTIFRAPLSFFLTTDTGVTLNRFGQDISLVDKDLPEAFSTLCTQIFKMAVQILLLLKVQPLLLIPFLICTIAIYLVQKYYLRTSRQLRVLDLESQSALYSSFLQTAEGLITIRSFKWQSEIDRNTMEILEYSLRPLYTLLCLQRWLSLVLGLIVGTIAVGLIGIAVARVDSTTGGDMGVALNVILVTNTTLVRLVESWTSMEISLGAIARLKSTELSTPQEDQPWEKDIPDPAWPTHGEIKIRGLKAGYSLDKPVLRSVDLDIPSGQKLAICGRTGSGKSTFLLAMLRLVESSGSIEVDGESISRIPRSIVRKRCFITVPQDPFIIPEATLRFNLGASDSVPDDALENALGKVGIWDHLSSGSSHHIESPLYQRLSMLPALSVGQSQLLSIARAIIQKKSLTSSIRFTDDPNTLPRPILILDEATSSLDSATESLIHDVLDKEFVKEGHTVIIVAHRLSALTGRMRSHGDAVALLQDGSLTTLNGLEDIMEGESSHK